MARPPQSEIKAVLDVLRKYQGIRRHGLYEKLDTLRPLWHIEPNLDQQPDVLKSVVEVQLDWLLDQDADRSGTVDADRNNERTRLLIHTAYNYGDLSGWDAASNLKQRQEWLAGQIARGVRSIYEDLDGITRKFAAILSSEKTMLLSRDELWERIEKRAKPKLEYVPRIGLEQEFEGLINEGHKAFLFCGDAGTGKSTLARTLADRLSIEPDRMVWLSADNEDSLLAGIIDYLYRDEREPNIGHKIIAMRTFARKLTTVNAPRVVVVDGVEDLRVIDALLPNDGEARPFVIITSRQPIQLGIELARIAIGEMSVSEATAMIQDRAASVTELDAKRLAFHLDYRPLAIEHACSLLKADGEDTIQDLCEMLRVAPLDVLDTVPSDTKLSGIYRKLLERIRISHHESLYQLIALVAATTSRGDVDSLEDFWLAYAEGNQERGHSHRDARINRKLSTRRFRAALDELEKLALLRLIYNQQGVSYEMHALTWRLLRWILHEYDPTGECEIANRILSYVFSDDAVTSWQAGQPLARDWSRRIPFILNPLRHPDHGPDIEERLHFATLLAQYDKQFGAGPDIVDHVVKLYGGTADSTIPTIQDKRMMLANLLLAAGHGGYACLDRGSEIRRPTDVNLGMLLVDPVVGDKWLTVNALYGDYATKVGGLLRSADSKAGLQRARIHQLQGTMACDSGDWDYADRLFERSYDLAARKQGAEWKATACETARRAIELAIKRNRLDIVRHWHTRLLGSADHLAYSDDVHNSHLLNALIEITDADVRLFEIYRLGPSQDEQVVEPELNDLCDRYWGIYQKLGQGKCQLGFRALFQYARCVAIQQPRKAIQHFTKLTETSHEHDTHVPCGPALTQIHKLYPLHEKARKQLSDPAAVLHEVGHLEQKAHEMRSSHASPYWTADALIAALSLAKQFKGVAAEEISRLEGAARQVLGPIDRLDRIELVEKVAGGEWDSRWLLAD